MDAGGAHGGERVPLPQQRRRHAALPRVPALSVAHPRYLGQGRPSRAAQGTIFRSNEYRGTNFADPWHFGMDTGSGIHASD